MKLVREEIMDDNRLYDEWLNLSIGTYCEVYVHWIPLEDVVLDLRHAFGINLGGMT